MNKDLLAIFDYLEKEKGIKRDLVISAIEESLLVAAKKNIQGASNLSVQINPKTGDIEVFSEKEIVAKAENSSEIALEDAQLIDPDCEIGQFIDVSIPTEDFGRIAAQKARQIITQKLRFAERDVIYQEYRGRVNEIISGSVKRFAGENIIVDLGKVEAILPVRNYPKMESYRIGERVHALLLEVKDTDNGGAQVVLSRSHPEFIRKLFVQEIPEVADGLIAIQRIVRDPGYRTKIAVKSFDSKIDPVGACIGMKGNRIKNILREIHNEKIDVIHYAEDPSEQLIHSIHPIVIRKLQINPTTQKISVVVDDQDFPAVVGKRGANSRLNSQLIEREIEIWKMSEYSKFISDECMKWAASDDHTLDETIESIPQINPLIVQSIVDSGYDTLRKILATQPEDLSKNSGISLEVANKILEEIRKQRM